MPKYRVLKLSVIDNHVRQPDDVVEYDGLPSDNLEPMCDIGRTRAEQAKEASRKLMEDILRGHMASSGTDARLIADAVAQGVSQALQSSVPAGGAKASKASKADALS